MAQSTQRPRRPVVRMTWVPPSAVRDTTAPPAASAVAEHLRRYGHLETTGAATPKDELLVLLALALEVEHALLVQYLFAAASVSPAAAKRKIVNVAIQEMAHLITVENLLLAVGGPGSLHIGRDGLRAGSDFNPLPLNLEPLSELSLKQYILAEMPAVIPDATLASRVDQFKRDVAAAVSGLTPHRVGALYARIYWILQPTDAPFGPLVLTPDPLIGLQPGWHLPVADFQPPAVTSAHGATMAEWNPVGWPDLRIHEVSDSLTAVTAVNSVMEQGEGLGHAMDSHFYEFIETLDLLISGGITVTPLTVNPHVGHPPVGGNVGTPITNDYVRLWANVFNLRYSTLVLSVGHAMLTPNTDPERALLIEVAFQNMIPWIRRLTAQMAALRIKDAASGPTFELLREDFPPDLAAAWLRQSELLDLEAGLRTALHAHADYAGDSAGQALLDALEADWTSMRAVVDAHLA